ncbi:FAD-binding oxidoreductase [Streptomyces sp. APSN-46.1]|uniref:FAD-binding oxidoreductase n=1 Tax=Streptomyces sp. APSN-46.1 TaxID=2929049 RepID=UPI001FB5062B|nr:FAD-binding oxidoreductase [Streptomyces sp. APSN-46.1]MCJ1679760.1 FAD-binding oxidoreductase [Streptomyces sp. APSN-46.1]
MAPFTKAATALAALREDVSGQVFAPADPGYEEARTVFNAMIDRRPAVIVQCESVPDVATAVRFARDLDLHIAVRGGGHSVAGQALNDGGVVVDLRRMHEVTVHPAAKAARIEGGATMSHLDRACQPHDLATTGGRASTTGVGGFVLGGGSGWLDRAFGLAVDNLLGVELVTADGSLVEATAEENPELFWALHGGGGNFGIATALTLRLHELPAMSMALVLYLPEHGRQAVRTYRNLIEAGPPEASGMVLYMCAPPEDFIPPRLVGQLLCGVLLTYAGPEERMRKLAGPLLALPHEAEIVTAIPYADLQCMIDDPPGLRNYWSAEYLTGLPDELVEVYCARGESLPLPTGTQHALWPQGGAIAAGPEVWPVPYRDAAWTVHPFGIWEDPADDARNIQFVKDVRADVQPWSTGAVYLNFIGDEGADRVVAGLGAENTRRLAAVKREYDPDNVFRFNHNIKPA